VRGCSCWTTGAEPADAPARTDASFRCSAASLAADEPLAGTASTIARWLLVEHDGPWGADALREARMPEPVRAFLRRAERTLRIRVLLVRRPDRVARGPRSVAAVHTGPDDPWIERAELPDLAELPAWDLSPLATGTSVGWAREDRPVFVVCTQGRRDPCCAERGRPLAAALAAVHPEATWEATHVGGDRFAGNIVIFPEAVAAYRDGRIDLARFRGRACVPMDVQAAEHALRVERGWDRIDAVRPAAVERAGSAVRTAFATPDGPVVVSLARERAEPRPLTCHAEEPLAPWRYRVTAIGA
jgi:hypothetical protein